MDHDLAGLLENERVKLSPSHIKLYMRQLMEGTEYMHRVGVHVSAVRQALILFKNHILHRDMKAANLLISNDGSLKIADFGLARTFDPTVATDTGSHKRRYTNCVVTRWYRPPELLLGARQYGAEIDIWGIGWAILNPSPLRLLTCKIDVSLERCSPANQFCPEIQTSTNSIRSGDYVVPPTNTRGPTTTHFRGVRA